MPLLFWPRWWRKDGWSGRAEHIWAGSYYPLRRPLVSSFIGVSEKLQAATVRTSLTRCIKTLQSALSPLPRYPSALILIFFLIKHMLMAGSNVTLLCLYLTFLSPVLIAHVKLHQSQLSHAIREVQINQMQCVQQNSLQKWWQFKRRSKLKNKMPEGGSLWLEVG